MLSEAACQQIQALMGKYPQKRSALIPSLQLAQKEVGYLSPDTICEIARIFELSPNEVYEVASFYTMFYKKARGEICHPGLHEYLLPALQLRRRSWRISRSRLGIKPGETTPDRKYHSDGSGMPGFLRNQPRSCRSTKTITKISRRKNWIRSWTT